MKWHRGVEIIESEGENEDQWLVDSMGDRMKLGAQGRSKNAGGSRLVGKAKLRARARIQTSGQQVNDRAAAAASAGEQINKC